MAAAVRVVAEHPAAQPSRAGQPLVGVSGLSSLVETLRPMFAVEGALVRWVALRGALLFLQMSFSPDEPTMADVMGIAPGGTSLVSPPASASASEQQAYLSLYSSIIAKVRAYDELEHMSLNDVLGDTRFRGVDREAGFQLIAWTGAALVRSDRAETVNNIGDPGRIDRAGWYTEPMFSGSSQLRVQSAVCR